jgi:hypothetical protein
MNDKLTVMRSLSVTRVASLLLVGALGCGLISSDITKVTFDLPPKTYSFDSAQAGLPTAATPVVHCGSPDNIATMTVMDCCNPPAPLPKPNCVTNPVVCEAGVCTLEQPVTVSQTMNLKAEVGVLQSVNSQSLVDISLQSLHYVAANTLTIDVPPIDLYLAPGTVTDWKDPAAMKFGSVPALAHGMPADGDVILDDGSDALFAKYGHDFGTPFNFIAKTTISVPSGAAPPQGAITITVTGKVSAKL